MGRILVCCKGFGNHLEILCHPICNRLSQKIFYESNAQMRSPRKTPQDKTFQAPISEHFLVNTKHILYIIYKCSPRKSPRKNNFQGPISEHFLFNTKCILYIIHKCSPRKSPRKNKVSVRTTGEGKAPLVPPPLLGSPQRHIMITGHSP